MTETIEEIANDPKARGKLQALRTMSEDLQKEIDALRDKKTNQDGRKIAAQRIAASMQGIIDEIRKHGKEGGLDPDDVKQRVDLVGRCRDLAAGQAGDAEKEMTLFNGEARALLRQIESVKKMHATAVAEEQRKARIAAQDRAEREEREKKAKAAKAETKKTGTRKAKALPKRAIAPKRAPKKKRGQST